MPNRQERRAAAAETRRNLKHMKQRCAGCERTSVPMTKEHYWPRWLTDRTNANRQGVLWAGGKRVAPQRATVPLCEDCNNIFGNVLEAPMARAFDDLEEGRGLSEREVDLFIRWLWKMEGIMWVASFPGGTYSPWWTLRQRIIERPIDPIRPSLILAASLIDERDDVRPLGMDFPPSDNAIYVNGVFGNVAVMTLLEDVIADVPEQFSMYAFGEEAADNLDEKAFYPKTGFATYGEAIETMRELGPTMVAKHRLIGEAVQQRFESLGKGDWKQVHQTVREVSGVIKSGL